LKKQISGLLFLFLVISFIFSGCFILEMVFPPLEKGKSNLSVYLHFKNLIVMNQRFESITVYAKSIKLGEKSKELNREIIIKSTPEKRIIEITNLFETGGIPNLEQLIFEKDEVVSNPEIILEIGDFATVSYLIENTEDLTEESTIVLYSIPSNQRNISFPTMELGSNEFRRKGSMQMPGGQSELVCLLNLQEIIPFESLTQGTSYSLSFSKNISMLSKDFCLVYGQVICQKQSEILEPGQNWLLSFENNEGILYFDQYPFSTLSYKNSLYGEQRFYFLILPQMEVKSYSGKLSLFDPVDEFPDASIDISVPYTNNFLDKNFTYDPGT